MSEAPLDGVLGAAPPKPVKRRYRSKLSAGQRSEIARRNQRARIPTEPHPYNLKLVGPPRLIEGRPLREWLKGRMDRLRSQPFIWSVAWFGWDSLAGMIGRRLRDFARFPGERPVQPATVRKLKRALAAMQRDLDASRPF